MLARTDTADHFVYVVDDDVLVREALLDLLHAARLNAIAFACASDYVAYARPDVPGCLVLDVELPDVNGLELQGRLASGGHPPIIFLTGHGDVPRSVRAVKAGAIDFLTKPFSKAALLTSIHEALAHDRAAHEERAALAEMRCRLTLLTRRECEVLPLVIGGRLNKQAAAELGISEVTLQIHRSRIMHKMQAGSLAELVRMASRLGIEPASPHPAGRARA